MAGMKRVIAFDGMGRMHPADGNPEPPQPGDNLFIGEQEIGYVLSVSDDGSEMKVGASFYLHPTFRTDARSTITT